MATYPLERTFFLHLRRTGNFLSGFGLDFPVLRKDAAAPSYAPGRSRGQPGPGLRPRARVASPGRRRVETTAGAREVQHERNATQRSPSIFPSLLLLVVVVTGYCRAGLPKKWGRRLRPLLGLRRTRLATHQADVSSEVKLWLFVCCLLSSHFQHVKGQSVQGPGNLPDG